MSQPTNRRDFLVTTASAAAVVATGTLAACGGGSSTAASEFKYGVASGDPLTDRVVLWTHAKVPNSNASVNLTWQISADDKFAVLVNSGKLTTTADSSFTAKVDATGLTAGATYFYRFMDETGVVSPVGTTRT